MAKSIYFDYAAATPMDKRVVMAMEPYFTNKFYNPSAIYLSAKKARQDLELARKSIAKSLGANSSEIIFTAGATEANNLAVRGVATMFPKSEIIVSAIEHDSVLTPAKELQAKIAPVKNNGIVDLEALKKLVTNNTSLVSVMLVNNELGVVQPLTDVAKIVQDERKKRQKTGNNLPIYLHSDLAQSPNYLDIHMSRFGLDLATINGGKIYGPKQSGALYIRAGILLKPQITGGGQEQNIRSGTENVPACIGLARALELSVAMRKTEHDRVFRLRQTLETNLEKNFKDVAINGSKKHRAPHIVSATFEGQDNERLMMELDEIGLMVAVGSACSASSDEPSHVLKAIGLSDAQAQATLRISLGRQTTEKDVKKLIKGISKVLKQFL